MVMLPQFPKTFTPMVFHDDVLRHTCAKTVARMTRAVSCAIGRYVCRPKLAGVRKRERLFPVGNYTSKIHVLRYLLPHLEPV